MGRLVKSEFRKIFSTKLWWALLIPAVAIALLANLGLAAAKRGVEDQGIGTTSVPVALLSLGLSFSFTAIFAAVYGATALSGEFRHRTITTTYLIGSRGAVLGAKVIVFAIMGLIYGVFTLLFSTLGAWIGGGSDPLPPAGSWLLLSLVGIVMITLWTLLGVGLGAWIKNQIAVVVLLAIYIPVGEKIVQLVLSAAKANSAAFYLPAASASDTVVKFAFDRFLADSSISASGQDAAQNIFSTAGVPAWWISGLVFIGYTVVVSLIGWAVSRSRDIT